jgi:glycosyltransferase involved in cell wall biosynthesis
MRVALLAPEFLPPWGGVGVYSFELARALSRNRKLELHVLTPVRERRCSEEELARYFRHQVHVHYLSTARDSFFYNLNFQLALWKSFAALHGQYRFDLVHSANLVHMPDIFLKFRSWEIPFVTTIHTTLDGQSRVNGTKTYNSLGLAPVEVFSRLAYPYIKTMEKLYLRRSRNFICVSNWVKSLAGVQAEVIHNGVDEKRFRPVQRRNDVPVVLYVGRLLAMKGIDCMIDALRPLMLQKKIRLLCMGAGNSNRYVRKLSGIDPEYYRFLGAVPYEKIHEVYQQADLFVLPSLTESFPLSVLEAMASGLPVVATKVGGIPEMISDGKNGLLVEPNNSGQLRDAVQGLLCNARLKRALEANARQSVESNFTSSLMAKQTYRVYSRLVQP